MKSTHLSPGGGPPLWITQAPMGAQSDTEYGSDIADDTPSPLI